MPKPGMRQRRHDAVVKSLIGNGWREIHALSRPNETRMRRTAAEDDLIVGEGGGTYWKGRKGDPPVRKALIKDDTSIREAMESWRQVD